MLSVTEANNILKTKLMSLSEQVMFYYPYITDQLPPYFSHYNIKLNEHHTCYNYKLLKQ